ncbi:hypothetical protein ACQP2F_14430 [Actinoplanes sp. CA-030573]|uniref:hypothetical protein n=1 Tax=Actinoplanes sp. CA-030573 TaxID=3239898 RepID=UPI003D8EEF32
MSATTPGAPRRSARTRSAPPPAAPWPSTPLDAVQRAFDLLVCPPAPLSFDGRHVDGLPDRDLPLDELKLLLLDDATSRAVRDQVWRELVLRARRDGPAWVIAAAGLALPGLRRAAGRLSIGWHGDSSDRDGELLLGFVHRLGTLDLEHGRIAGKLIDAGARAARQAQARCAEAEAVKARVTRSMPPQQPWDHPDWVLARAVSEAVISPEECLLIAETRLDRIELPVIAERLGVSVEVASAWRRKAEHRLAAAIHAGELEWVSLAATSAIG